MAERCPSCVYREQSQRRGIFDTLSAVQRRTMLNEIDPEPLDCIAAKGRIRGRQYTLRYHISELNSFAVWKCMEMMLSYEIKKIRYCAIRYDMMCEVNAHGEGCIGPELFKHTQRTPIWF